MYTKPVKQNCDNRMFKLLKTKLGTALSINEHEVVTFLFPL